MKRTIVFLALLTLTGFLACKKSGKPYTPECSGDAPKFAATVSGVIASECATSGCHASGSNNGPGALTTYAQVKAAASSIRSEVVSGGMPKNKVMSTENRNAIVCWIDAGANND